MKKVWKVSEISAAVKDSLESKFFDISVIGEIRGLKWHTSGHVYFSLIDDKTVLNTAFFRRYIENLSFVPKDGMLVVAYGTISSYPPRSNYQLICRKIEQAGVGEKLLAIMRLKERLQGEGLFDRSRLLPKFPKNIAVITSLSGAAKEDIKNVIARRFGGINLYLFDSLVEGSNAESSMLRAIHRVKESISILNLDLLIIARGGGSKESLDLFNNEFVARTLYTVEIPIISAVGHQIDTTVVDFVADRRAETPSSAAEMACPDIHELSARYDTVRLSLIKSIRLYLEDKQLSYTRSSGMISKDSFYKLLDRKSQLTDFGISNLALIYRNLFLKQLHRYRMVSDKLIGLKLQFIKEYKIKTYSLISGMNQAIAYESMQRRTKVESIIELLKTLSPVATLKRGYTITLKNGKLCRFADIETADLIETRFYDGVVKSKIQ